MKKSHYCALLAHYHSLGYPLTPNQQINEVFKNKNEEAFSGIPGIHIVADEIIIAAASSNQEHNQILTQRAKDCITVFNQNKLQLRVNEVKYLETIVTPEGIKQDPSK